LFSHEHSEIRPTGRTIYYYPRLGTKRVKNDNNINITIIRKIRKRNKTITVYGYSLLLFIDIIAFICRLIVHDRVSFPFKVQEYFCKILYLHCKKQRLKVSVCIVSIYNIILLCRKRNRTSNLYAYINIFCV